jgi:6-phosphogluconolactonase
MHALLLTELSAELLLLRRDGAAFKLLDSVKTLPEPHDDNLGGHLAVEADGRIFVTNRGHDSLVVFTIADGRLDRRGWVYTGEASPRHFQLGADDVLVAHEEGGALSLVPQPGTIVDGAGARQIVPLPGAVFIIEIPD